ncbi:MAG: alpha/beta hydrolase [Bacillota bacterium]|nr:alpha/beta hydrolase [Bacillota bacterium]
MLYKVFDMSVEGSVGNPTLTTYLIDASDSLLIRERPMIVICPGGGYSMVSDREGEMIALQFAAMGFHTAILRYSVSPAVYPTQLLELTKAMVLIRQNAEKWHIEKNKIFIQGSSAGGHLAASFGCFWKKEFLREAAGGDSELIRPNGLILSYPVITSGEYAHRDSFVKLLRERYDKLVQEMSLENQVNEDTPKTFLWHTFEDGLVPVENSLLFMQALRKKGIIFESHIYPKGAHGLSLGNELTCSPEGNEIQPEVSSWILLAQHFIKSFR